MRHPVERIISRFHALKGSNATEVKDMTLESYARSEVVDQNWMVRMLTNTTDDQVLTPAHYQVAKEVFEEADVEDNGCFHPQCKLPLP